MREPVAILTATRCLARFGVAGAPDPSSPALLPSHRLPYAVNVSAHKVECIRTRSEILNPHRLPREIGFYLATNSHIARTGLEFGQLHVTTAACRFAWVVHFRGFRGEEAFFRSIFVSRPRLCKGTLHSSLFIHAAGEHPDNIAIGYIESLPHFQAFFFILISLAAN